MTLPDGVHVFHAYIHNGYCWTKVTNSMTNKIVGVYPLQLKKGWKTSLFFALDQARSRHRDRVGEIVARAARFCKPIT